MRKILPNRARRFKNAVKDWLTVAGLGLAIIAVVGVIIFFFSFFLLLFLGIVAFGAVVFACWFVFGKPITITVDDVPTYEIRRFKVKRLPNVKQN